MKSPLIPFYISQLHSNIRQTLHGDNYGPQLVVKVKHVSHPVIEIKHGFHCVGDREFEKHGELLESHVTAITPRLSTEALQ